MRRYPTTIRTSLRPFLPRPAQIKSPVRHAATTNPASKGTSAPLKARSVPLFTRDYVSQLIKDSGVRRIYQSPSNLSYHTGIWTGALMCFGCAFEMGTFYTSGGSDVPSWAPYVSAAPVLFLAGMGTWFLLKSVNIIQAIDVVPSKTGLRLHTYIRPALPIPLLRGRMFETLPRDVHLFCREPTLGRLPAETSSGNSVAGLLENIFTGSRKVFTSEGFVNVSVADRKGPFKLDMTGDFVADRRILRTLLSFDS